jgi:hypothetical protein
VQLGAADGRHGAVIGKPRRLGLLGKRQAPPLEPRRRAPNTPIRAVVAQVVARRSWKPRPTLPATSRSIAEDMKAIVAVRSRQRHLRCPVVINGATRSCGRRCEHAQTTSPSTPNLDISLRRSN